MYGEARGRITELMYGEARGRITELMYGEARGRITELTYGEERGRITELMYGTVMEVVGGDDDGMLQMYSGCNSMVIALAEDDAKVEQKVYGVRF